MKKQMWCDSAPTGHSTGLGGLSRRQQLDGPVSSFPVELICAEAGYR